MFHDSNWLHPERNLDMHYASLYDPKLEDFPYASAEKATAAPPVNTLTKSFIKRPVNLSMGKLKPLRKSANLDKINLPTRRDVVLSSK